MGNWRTVNVTGTMSAQDAEAVRDYLGYPDLSRYRPDLGMERDPAMDHFGPLSFCRHKPSLAGLGDWPAPVMNRAGNLAERGYDPDDVAEQLRELVAFAGSMLLKVHCGGDYESLECVATVSVGEGLVMVGRPEVERIEPMGEAQATLNVLRALSAF